jgi:hypothetical protein
MPSAAAYPLRVSAMNLAPGKFRSSQGIRRTSEQDFSRNTGRSVSNQKHQSLRTTSASAGPRASRATSSSRTFHHIRVHPTSSGATSSDVRNTPSPGSEAHARLPAMRSCTSVVPPS